MFINILTGHRCLSFPHNSSKMGWQLVCRVAEATLENIEKILGTDFQMAKSIYV